MKEVTWSEANSDLSNAVIYVSAPWCGPCKTVSPFIEAAETEMSASIMKVNADECLPEVKGLGVREVPTLLMFKDNKLVSLVSSLSKKSPAELKELLIKF